VQSTSTTSRVFSRARWRHGTSLCESRFHRDAIYFIFGNSQ
jgi:hypothetical protein